MQVGFKWQWTEYSAAKPCRFNQCLSADWENWAARATQFADVLSTRIDGDAARHAVVSGLKSRIARAYKYGCSALAAVWPSKQEICQHGVAVFVTSCQFAAEAAKQWGRPITVGDGAGFDLAYDWGGRRPSLPIPGGDWPDMTIPPDVTHPDPGMIPGSGDMFDIIGTLGRMVPILIGLLIVKQVTSIYSDVK